MDDAGWRPYDPAVSAQLEQAFSAGPTANGSSVPLRPGGQGYVFLFDRMCQQNPSSGYERECCFAAAVKQVLIACSS
jgi:hypothetical protein